MCWCAPTTHQWSLISTTKDICARATCTGWRTRSLCGPKGDSAHWEQYISLGILLRQEPRPGEWMLHPDVVKKIGECFATLRYSGVVGVIRWSWCRLHRACFYTSWSLSHPACDVSPIIWTDYTWYSELLMLETFPKASYRMQRLVPSRNQGYLRNLRNFV